MDRCTRFVEGLADFNPVASSVGVAFEEQNLVRDAVDGYQLVKPMLWWTQLSAPNHPACARNGAGGDRARMPTKRGAIFITSI